MRANAGHDNKLTASQVGGDGILRRADRLFQIVQIVRGARRPITAAELAGELELSPRTIYRDIADLMASGVPLRGEAGVGYVLEAGYELPPLMLTAVELEAALLGAQWVSGRGDPSLARAARDLVAKLQAVAPKELLFLADGPSVLAPNLVTAQEQIVDLQRVRDAIHSRHKLVVDYFDENDRVTRRVIWPVYVAYFAAVRVIVAWCELRDGFRHFRTDRIKEITYSSDQFSTPMRRLRKAWADQEGPKGRNNAGVSCRLV
jgi:predicted DNA-binding transcriptional regulator YafY